MKVLIFLFATAVVVWSQIPRPCESPKQWEGRIHEVDRNFSFQLNGRAFMDETNERLRIIEEIESTDERDFFDYLYLYRERKQYKVNLKTRQCTTVTLTNHFIPLGIPQNAIFDFEVVIGVPSIPGESVTVVEWHGTAPQPQGGEYFGTVTVPDCIPVRAGYFDNSSGLIIANFYDITLGISDPEAFIPPRECTP